ncbi:MAG: hypothetical protein DRJ96_02265 [Thermoprotei archaeon]|nr:MAG: hypothetical protein DRJ96_02265 [Thermoprotei archaeon]
MHRAAPQKLEAVLFNVAEASLLSQEEGVRAPPNWRVRLRIKLLLFMEPRELVTAFVSFAYVRQASMPALTPGALPTLLLPMSIVSVEEECTAYT